MSLDVARARAETPGCANVTHLNNAGAGLMPDVVLETMFEHLELEARIGGYEAAAAEGARVEAVYDSVARLLGCSRDEVAIVENATRAWDMAFYSFDFQPGDRILTCGAEYASNYIALLQVARRTGAEIVVVGDDESGRVSLAALEEELGRGARLVSLVHVPSQGGLVQPAAAVGALCRAAGVPLLLDACQSVGQLPTDVGELQCDILSATGRKFLRGPRGTGFLYVRQELLEQLEPPFLDLHAAEWIDRDTFAIRPDARRFENWETSYATKLGLGAAVDYALGWGLDAIAERVGALAALMRVALEALPGVEVHDRGEQKCGIVTFSVPGNEAGDVVTRLGGAGVNVSLMPVAYSRLDLGVRGLDAIVRASPHYYNTEAEVGRLVELVAGMLGGS